MSTTFEISTKNYSDDLLMVKKALSHMETLTGNYNGYVLGQPSDKIGWAFFSLTLRPELDGSIRDKFSDMIGRYRRGNQNEKFTKFMDDYFRAKGCNVKLRMIG